MASPQTGAPPGADKRNGPGGVTSPQGRTSTHQTTTTKDSLTELVAVAQRLVEQLGDQAAADKAAFEQAYKLGYESGVVVGRQQLGHEIIREEERFGRHMSAISRLPIYAELEARRWDGKREHFADARPGDYQGGLVDWESSRPVPGQGAA